MRLGMPGPSERASGSALRWSHDGGDQRAVGRCPAGEP